MIKISTTIVIPDAELDITFIRAPGPGGQNVNKVASAVLLRFNVLSARSLSETLRARLITLNGSQLTSQGDLLIKASRYRTQERNKQDALQRLKVLIQRALVPQKKRKKTKPTLASKEKRLNTKKWRGKTKALRKKDSGGHFS